MDGVLVVCKDGPGRSWGCTVAFPCESEALNKYLNDVNFDFRRSEIADAEFYSRLHNSVNPEI